MQLQEQEEQAANDPDDSRASRARRQEKVTKQRRRVEKTVCRSQMMNTLASRVSGVLLQNLSDLLQQCPKSYCACGYLRTEGLRLCCDTVMKHGVRCESKIITLSQRREFGKSASLQSRSKTVVVVKTSVFLLLLTLSVPFFRLGLHFLTQLSNSCFTDKQCDSIGSN